MESEKYSLRVRNQKEGQSMSIVVLGSMNIDQFFDVDHFVSPSETLRPLAVNRACGGKGLNQAIAASKAGSPVRMTGCLGKDGQELTQVLKNAGVNTADIQIQESALSGQAVIQRTPDGENAILLYPGANDQIECGYIDEILDSMGSDDILLIQNEISNLNHILNSANSREIPVFFNPAPMSEEVKNADLSGIACLIVNEKEAVSLCGFADQIPESQDVFIRLIEKTKPKRAVMTLGSKGALCFEKPEQENAVSSKSTTAGSIFRMPCFPADVCDSTGAGDTFTGYLCSGIEQGLGFTDAIRKAAAAASVCVERKGAAPSIPSSEEAAERMNCYPDVQPYSIF